MRPKDLPQPVREHRSHDSLYQRSSSTPGPGTYHSAAFKPSSNTPGFSKAARFKEAISRNSLDVHPGPCYNVGFQDKKIGISFKGARSQASVETRVGPGSYNVAAGTAGHSTAISFPKSKRQDATSQVTKNPTPGPDQYNPQKPPRNRGRAFFGTSGRCTGGLNGDAETAIFSQASPPSLEHMDMAIEFVRPKVAAPISFGRPPSAKSRDLREVTTSVVGPGSYNVVDKYVRPSVHGGSFGSAKSSSNCAALAATDAIGYGDGSTTSKLSTKPKAAAASFGSASRGSVFNAGNSEQSCGALYKPSYHQVDPHVKLCTEWKAPRPQPVTSYSDAPPLSNPVSTLGGPQVTFPKSLRPSSRPGSTASSSALVPGPGEYSPQIAMTRPQSAGRSFGKAPRHTGIATESAREFRGDMNYNPKFDLLQHGSPAFSFSKGRPSSAPSRRAAEETPSGLSYNPSYRHVEKGGHAAILYLTG